MDKERIVHRQKGVTLGGFLTFAVVFSLVTLVGLKVVPPYIEFFNIKKNLRATAKEPGADESTPAQLRAAYDRRAGIDNITVIKPSDVAVVREGNTPVLSVAYSVRVPLMANVSICLDFVGSSRD